MTFSVLMSIYHREDPRFFERAMRSIWDEQTRRPDEIVLVRDGPLPVALQESIAWWSRRIGAAFVLVPLEQNVGLGRALNIGLGHCRHDIVARMDTDDIALPERFAVQCDVLSAGDVDVCGSWVSEFDEDESVTVSVRKVPEGHDEILRFAKRRNPMNHPSVMYRKSFVEKAGNYQDMAGFEDYYLWVRMLVAGGRFHNIQQPLVHMRAGYGQLQRRSGLQYAANEYRFLSTLRTFGFLSWGSYAGNLLIRYPARMIPRTWLKMIYKTIRG